MEYIHQGELLELRIKRREYDTKGTETYVSREISLFAEDDLVDVERGREICDDLFQHSLVHRDPAPAKKNQIISDVGFVK
jgi:hypothetical protein